MKMATWEVPYKSTLELAVAKHNFNELRKEIREILKNNEIEPIEKVGFLVEEEV